MAHPTRVGVKRKYVSQNDMEKARLASVSQYSGEEIDRERDALRKRRAVLLKSRPDAIRKKDFLSVRDEDVVKSLHRKHGSRLAFSSDAVTIESVSADRGSVINEEATAADTNDTIEDMDVHVDLESLQREQIKERRNAAALKLIHKLIDSLVQFESMDRIVSHWMMSKIPGCATSQAYLSRMLCALITRPIQLRVFKSNTGERDELYLFGDDVQFFMPFTMLSANTKLIVAMIMKRARMMFGVMEQRMQGVCGVMHVRFVFNEQLQAASGECLLREQFLNHVMMTSLHHANQRCNVRGAVSMFFSMASDIYGEHVAPIAHAAQSASKLELAAEKDMRRALNSMFRVLLDAAALSQQLCEFSRRAAIAREKWFRPQNVRMLTQPASGVRHKRLQQGLG